MSSHSNQKESTMESTSSENGADWSRRTFIVSLAVISLGGPQLRAMAASDWVPIGSADSIKQGQVLRVVASGAVVFLSRDDAGSVTALSGVCTHLGCSVDWDGKRSQFACPCHGGRFDRTGKNVSGPPPRPLNNIQVRIDSDQTVYVKTTG